MRHAKILIFLTLAAVVFIAYGNVLKGPFLYDDNMLIVENPLIKNLSNALTYFRTDLFSYGPGERMSNSFRPMHTFLNAVDYFLWGDNSAGFHFTNVFLHLINVLLIFILLRNISKSALIAYLTAILYALHPINTQSVSYIAGRGDVLMSLFAALSLICYIAWYGKKTGGFLALSVFFYALSVLSREASLIVLPLLIIGYIMYFGKPGSHSFKSIIPYFIVAIIYLFLRILILGVYIAPVGLEYVSFYRRLLTSIKGLFISLGIILAPSGLHFDRFTAVERSILSPIALISLIGLIAAVFAVVYLYKIGLKESRKFAALVSFGFFWFLACMLPYFNIIPIQVFVSENWLYQPSVGIFFVAGTVVAFVFNRLKAKSMPVASYAVIAVFALTSLIYGFITHKRNADYLDPIRLFQANLRCEPNVKFYYMLGTEYGLKKEYNLALEAFKKAIETDKTRPNLFVFNARFNLAVTYLRLKDRQRALEEFKYLSDLKNVPDYVKIMWKERAAEVMKKLQY
ncbi:MAG: hypothetical protein JW994_02205 [Candidatus Omnitrophica bacterium]|nr:hypothetical protein [Candidatus Omnitrophota bacterium]